VDNAMVNHGEYEWVIDDNVSEYGKFTSMLAQECGSMYTHSCDDLKALINDSSVVM